MIFPPARKQLKTRKLQVVSFCRRQPHDVCAVLCNYIIINVLLNYGRDHTRQRRQQFWIIGIDRGDVTELSK